MRKLIIVLTGLTFFAPLASAAGWWETVKVKGDFRYRHEMIDTEEKDAYNRQRIRARLAVEGQVSPTTKIGIQLATGSDDPVSTNQTLTGGFTSKNVVVDMAYFDYKPAAVPGLKVTAGKFHNPFFKPGSSELIWDSDFNPEGGAATYSSDFDNINITLIGSGLWVQERSTNDDSWMGVGQGIFRYNTNEKKSSIVVGAGYFDYVNSKGFVPFYDGNGRGNTVVPAIAGIDEATNDTTYVDVYADEYRLLEAFVELSHHFEEVPVKMMFDYVNNTAADSVNTGWLTGIHIGKTKKTWSWALRYIYRRVEKDAVVGTFTDSDFRGGGTDAKGHEIGGSLQLAENTTFSVSYFMNKIGLDSKESDFKRLQVDLQLKF